MHYIIFFLDVKGRGSMGFSPGWKAVNVQSIKLTASVETSVWGHLIFGLSPELHPLIISLLFSNSSTGFLSNFTWTLKSCLHTFKAIHNIDLCMCMVWRNQDGTQESYLEHCQRRIWLSFGDIVIYWDKTVEPLFEKKKTQQLFSAWNFSSHKNTSNYRLEK